MSFGVNYKPDPQIDFPRSVGEAKEIIAGTFKFNDWKKNEQRRYLNGLGFDKDLSDLDLSETRTVITDLQKSGMVLFKTC